MGANRTVVGHTRRGGEGIWGEGHKTRAPDKSNRECTTSKFFVLSLPHLPRATASLPSLAGQT